MSRKFPKDFAWGVSTSSYQIEGAWDLDGKGKSIWDDFTHSPKHVEDGSNGDIACDSYHMLEDDVAMLVNVGVSHYRFSLSWPRIMPAGRSNQINKAGVEYYNRLINLLLSNNIQPCVTLYHWDLPSALEEIGGWLNEEIVDLFADYAKFCFAEFGDRVKMWITINEPQIVAYLGYCLGLHAPGIKDPLVKPYKVSRTLILSHARAWRIYDEKFRDKQGGKVSIAINSDWGEPANGGKDERDKEAAELYMQFTKCWFADPIYLSGDYPPLMKQALEERRIREGGERSRLPEFSEEEKKMIKGTYDFFALNHYTTRYISHCAEKQGENSEIGLGRIHPDLDAASYPDSSWDRAGSPWLYIVPWGLRKLLCYISKRYNNPPIYITENGCSTKHDPKATNEETLQSEDTQRVNYLTSYIEEVLKAHLEDGVNIKGYFVWSLMDNFEWSAGYTERFGLYHVDFTKGGTASRTPRKSLNTYKTIIADNGF